MSKKHFIELADLIRNHNSVMPDQAFTTEQIRTLAMFCREQNPNFKQDRWLDYIAGKCGSSGGAIKQPVSA
jgi:hypothetical protein